TMIDACNAVEPIAAPATPICSGNLPRSRESLVMSGRVGIVSRLIMAAFLMCAGMGSVAHAEKRVALVIGNSAYRTVPALPNPAGDARLMSDTLTSLGFSLVGGGAHTDLDKAGFEAALKQFAAQLA